jgi:competence protein ComEC
VRRRVWLAFSIALAALVFTGALTIQLRASRSVAGTIPPEFLAFEEEAIVTAHVTHEGEIREAFFGSQRQTIDVETEDITSGEQAFSTHVRLRLAIYAKTSAVEDAQASAPPAMRLYLYGERLRFAAKLRTPRNFGNPGAFDYREYLAEQGITLLGSTQSTKINALPGFVGNRVEQWRETVHHALIAKIHSLWSPKDAALMDAAVVGESAFLTPATRMDFQRSGTYHILVVSGMNVSILAFVVFWTMRWLRLGTFAASVLTIVLCVAYAFVTDVGAPVWRAVLMMTVYLGTRLLYRERSMLNALGAAALSVMVADPKALLGASFQLTFLAVLLIAAIAVPVLERTSQPYLRGLLHLGSMDFDRTLPARVAQMRLDVRLIAERLEQWMPLRLASGIVGGSARAVLAAYELLFVSFVMQVGLALPMAYYFHRATVMGIPANSLAVPLTGILMPAAVLAVALGFVWLPLGKIPAWGATMALHAITDAVRWLGGMRIADHRVAKPETVAILITVCAVVLAMVAVRRRKAFAACGLFLLAAAGFWVSFRIPHPGVQEGKLEVTAIDVGQGDSILVVSPQGRTLLVDAGGPVGGQLSEFDFGENVVSPYLWERRISQLDAAAITHGHSDHIGGMHAILNNFRPRELWVGALPDSPANTALLKEAEHLGIRVLRPSEHDTFSFGGMEVKVFSPPADWHTTTRPRNNDSLVLQLRYKNSRVLLEGDAEQPIEQRMAAVHDLRADLLKVGHHGSATSSSIDFINAVQPRWAIICVGARNGFGHPRRETLEKLQQEGAATYRTDRNGAVSFYLDGQSVSPQLACLR